MTETKLKDKVLKFLKTLPKAAFRKIHQSPMSKAGTADIIGCYKGRAVAIELKRPGKYKNADRGCTPAQVRFLYEWARAGGFPFVTDSLEEVKDFIAGFAYIED